MNTSLKALLNEQYKLVAELREENKNLKEWNNELIENHKKDIDVLCEENKELREENEILRCNKGGTPEKVGHEEMIQYLMKENKKLKETIKDHQLYEEKLEHRIIEFEELLHGE